MIGKRFTLLALALCLGMMSACGDNTADTDIMSEIVSGAGRIVEDLARNVNAFAIVCKMVQRTVSAAEDDYVLSVDGGKKIAVGGYFRYVLVNDLLLIQRGKRLRLFCDVAVTCDGII